MGAEWRGQERINQTLILLCAEAEQFADAVQAAHEWLRPMDAERFVRQFEWFRQKINDGIAASERSEGNALQALAAAALEAWRFERVSEKAMRRMNLLGLEPFLNRYNWFVKRLDQVLALSAISVIDLTGERYSIGMAVSALNSDEFGDEELRIVRMVDPVIMMDGRVLRIGTVLLGQEEG